MDDGQRIRVEDGDQRVRVEPLALLDRPSISGYPPVLADGLGLPAIGHVGFSESLRRGGGGRAGLVPTHLRPLTILSLALSQMAPGGSLKKKKKEVTTYLPDREDHVSSSVAYP